MFVSKILTLDPQDFQQSNKPHDMGEARPDPEPDESHPADWELVMLFDNEPDGMRRFLGLAVRPGNQNQSGVSI